MLGALWGDMYFVQHPFFGYADPGRRRVGGYSCSRPRVLFVQPHGERPEAPGWDSEYENRVWPE